LNWDLLLAEAAVGLWISVQFVSWLVG